MNSSNKLLREERETHYYTDDMSNEWLCDTSIQKDIRRLRKQGWIQTSETLYDDGTIMSASFRAPRNCLSPRLFNPNKPKRIMSDEHKQKLAEARAKKG